MQAAVQWKLFATGNKKDHQQASDGTSRKKESQLLFEESQLLTNVYQRGCQQWSSVPLHTIQASLRPVLLFQLYDEDTKCCTTTEFGIK